MSSIEGLELFLNRLLALEFEDLTFYFVGGLIRDMLWHQMTDDIDIAFEGAFEKLVEGLSGNYDLQLSSVNTIQLTIGHYHIDLAQMRYESYPFNDGMPVISAGAITDDIKRRDFTINTAYAICNLNNIKTVINFLSSKRTNPLEITYAHDYFLRDFNNRVIACLHEQSFLEDPTRLSLIHI